MIRCPASSVRSSLTLFIASWYAGRYGCSLGKLNRLFTLGGQLKDLLMPASTSNPCQFFYVHPFPKQSMDSCRVQRPSKVFCFQAAYHGALVRRSWG